MRRTGITRRTEVRFSASTNQQQQWGKIMGIKRWIAAGALAFGLPAVMSGAAAADPVNAKNAFRTQLNCDNGQTYDIVVNGNGAYTPAHIVGSTSVLVPFAFGEFTGMATFPDGTTETFTEPATSKKAASRQRGLVNCSFSFTGTEDGVTFSATGSVLVKVTPARGR